MIGDCNCDQPNYGHLHRDEASGLLYITERGTKRKMFKLPPCRICEIARYSYSTDVTETCGACRPGRVEANENEEAAC